MAGPMGHALLGDRPDAHRAPDWPAAAREK
jgi:hypothetical protein